MNAEATNAARTPHLLLRRAARALRAGRSVTALTAGCVAAGVLLAAWLIADSRIGFGTIGRWLGFAAIALPPAAAIIHACRSWLARIDDAALARRLEAATGRADNALVNAVQLDRSLDPVSPWRAVLLGELAGRWSDTPWNRVYNWRLLWRWAAGAAVLFLLGSAFYFFKPDEFRQRVSRVLLPASEIAPVTLTRILDVTPGNQVVPRDTPLDMSATIGGRIPDKVWLVVAEDLGGQMDRIALQRDGTSPRWSVERRWLKSGRYWFEAGDARSFTRRIGVKQPAKVIAANLTITPPPYTKLAATHVAEGASWPAIPAGSDVTLLWTFDHPVTRMSVEDDRAKVSPLAKAGSWKLTGRPVSGQPWNVTWNDTSDLTGNERVSFQIKADESPRVRWIRPTGEEELLMTRDSSLALTFEATDDHGLAEVTLYRGTPDKPDATPVRSWKPDASSFKQSMDLQLSRWISAEESEAWFSVAATDANDVTGPGRTMSRILVVRIVTADELRRANETRENVVLGGVDELLRMQQENLDATRATIRDAKADSDTRRAAIETLAERQSRIGREADRLVSSTPDGSAAWHDVLRSLAADELPNATLALRDALASDGGKRRQNLAKAEALETAILARLKNLPDDLRDESAGTAVRDLIGRVERLFKRQQDLHGRVLAGTPGGGAAMAADQDALADESRVIRQALAEGSNNASLGDAGFRTVLAKAADLMSETKIYEQMIQCAESIEGERFPESARLCKQVLVDLARVLELLSTSQRNRAGEKAESIREAAADIHGKLEDLAERQRAVVEKSKALATKDEFSPEDEAMAGELAAEKEAIAEMIEQMLTDAHVFPDLKPMNELREELTKIFEDVIQQDTEEAAAGKLKPTEIAVQKEEGLLEAIENAVETAEDMEMWLPDKNETVKWLMENFDLTEMPEIPNLPLADSFTDLVGELLEKQEGLDAQVQDAASNNAFAFNPANGWDVMDGPMPGFNAQGRSGNEAPNKNEQTGRSAGGREGMSSGEMVNQRADQLEGSETEARRTNDPLQKGKIEDDAPPANAKATGGGKAGGVSQREGMTGEAPLRPVNTADRVLNSALAAEQALLARQTSKSYANARLFYLRTGPMPEVARLMDESREALRSGRMADYKALHRRIVASLREMGGASPTDDIKVMGGTGSRTVGGKQLPGGADVAVPAEFQQPVDDYFRSLDSP